VKRYYPVFLDVAELPCVVVGGGAVAERKVDGLLDAGADVIVVSPALTERLATLAAEGRVRHLGRAYRPGDLCGARLAFVATDDRGANDAVAREARALGVWVNAADDPPHCDFVLPAVLARGALVVAVGTGGASPALAAVVRNEIAEHVGEDHGVLLEVAGDVRRTLLARGRAPSAERWRAALADADVRRLVADGRRDAARAALLDRLGGER
jgi:siroheme synthase-like protein